MARESHFPVLFAKVVSILTASSLRLWKSQNFKKNTNWIFFKKHQENQSQNFKSGASKAVFPSTEIEPSTETGIDGSVNFQIFITASIFLPYIKESTKFT